MLLPSLSANASVTSPSTCPLLAATISLHLLLQPNSLPIQKKTLSPIPIPPKEITHRRRPPSRNPPFAVDPPSFHALVAAFPLHSRSRSPTPAFPSSSTSKSPIVDDLPPPPQFHTPQHRPLPLPHLHLDVSDPAPPHPAVDVPLVVTPVANSSRAQQATTPQPPILPEHSIRPPPVADSSRAQQIHDLFFQQEPLRLLQLFFIFAMGKSSSALFAGLRFDKKRFATDVARFEPKVKEEERKENEESEQRVAAVTGTKMEKKRKRKRKEKVLDIVDGFSLFKSPESSLVGGKAGKSEDMEDDSSEQRKEAEKQIEQAALLRKKYGLHISGCNVPSPLQSFAELRSRYRCKSYLLHKLTELGFEEPTPIQRQAIPILLSGQECFACAPTGSGKTLAFLFPILMKIKPGSKDGIKAVVLCPTRELAAQTTRECKKLATGRKFYIKLMTKELSKCGEFEKMPCDILVSTPLRLEYAIRKRKLDLSRVDYLVLDESDKLFELGFVKQIDSVVKACSNPSIIRSLFSATLPDIVEELARSIMHDAVRVIVGRKNSASELIKQKLIFAGSEKGKLLALRQSFAESLNPPILVFVQSKERAKELYKELAFDNIKADVIHADLTQEQRENAVDNFRAGETWVLIATDVISRGMDFKGVNCVINYDFPESAAAYIHRIGRSGRAGRSGEAITLYTEEDKPFLRNIANVMAASGCKVPSWILALPKLRRKKHRPQRDNIATLPEGDAA